jgi:hypothetical protein
MTKILVISNLARHILQCKSYMKKFQLHILIVNKPFFDEKREKQMK